MPRSESFPESPSKSPEESISEKLEKQNIEEISDEELAEYFRSVEDVEIEVLLNKGELFDSGKHGLIFRLSPEIIEERLGRYLGEKEERQEEQGKLETEPKVIKLLKVFRPGEGEKEFRMQKAAFEMVEEARKEGNDLAGIPNPLAFRTVSITPETRELLNRQGAFLTEDKVEVILMEFVPGENLAKIFYKWILDHHPNPIRPNNEDDFYQLKNAVGILLGFVRPEQKRSILSHEERERIANHENSKKLYSYLEKGGFTISEEIVQRVIKTVELLNSKGFYHNDLHERNIMIVGNIESPEALVFIIDFSLADGRDPEKPDDAGVGLSLRKLTKEGRKRKEEEEKTGPYKKFLAQFNSTKKTITANPRLFLGEYKRIEGEIRRGSRNILDWELQGIAGEHSIMKFFMILEELLKNKIIALDELLNFLEKNKKLFLERRMFAYCEMISYFQQFLKEIGDRV